MGFASALTYDFEAASAAQEKWLEVSSQVELEAYQTNRMKIRFKDSNGKNQLVHLPPNGSSLALPFVCWKTNKQKRASTTGRSHRYFGAVPIN